MGSLWVAMATMDFQIAQTGLFLGNNFSHLGHPREQVGTNEKLPGWLQGMLN